MRTAARASCRRSAVATPTKPTQPVAGTAATSSGHAAGAICNGQWCTCDEFSRKIGMGWAHSHFHFSRKTYCIRTGWARRVTDTTAAAWQQTLRPCAPRRRRMSDVDYFAHDIVGHCACTMARARVVMSRDRSGLTEAAPCSARRSHSNSSSTPLARRAH